MKKILFGLLLAGSILILLVLLAGRGIRNYSIKYESPSRSIDIEYDNEGDEYAHNYSDQYETDMRVESEPQKASIFKTVLDYVKEIVLILTSIVGLVGMLRKNKKEPAGG